MTDNYRLDTPAPRRPLPDWRDQSACKAACDAGEAVTEWWFPDRGDDLNTREAKRICGTCPVQEPCLRWALENREHGIWAGTNLRSRQRMPKPQTCTECGEQFIHPPRLSKPTPTCGPECAKARKARVKRESYVRTGYQAAAQLRYRQRLREAG